MLPSMLKKEEALGVEAGFLWAFGGLANLAGWGGIAEIKGRIEKMKTN